MSTTPVTTWAVDLADVTLIYPWVGSEVAMVWITVVLLVIWQVWQVKFENKSYKEEMEKHANEENLKKAMSEH